MRRTCGVAEKSPPRNGDCGYLKHFRVRQGSQFFRIRFYKHKWEATSQFPLLIMSTTMKQSRKTPADELWASISADLTPSLAKSLQNTRLVGIEDGAATIETKRGADWMQNRLERPLLRALRLVREDVTAVRFVQNEPSQMVRCELASS